MPIRERFPQKYPRHSTDLRFNIDPPEGEREEFAIKPAQDIVSEYQSFLAEQQIRAITLSSLRDNARRAMNGMLGPAKSEALRKFRAENQPPPFQFPVTNPHELSERIHEETRRQSFQRARDLGIDLDQLQRLRRDWFTQQLRAIEPKAPAHSDVRLVRDIDVPAEIQQQKTNPWTIKKPPYSGGYEYYSYQRWGEGNLEFQDFSNPSSADLGLWSLYEDYNPDDWDMFFLWNQSSIAFWHKPKSSETTEIWIKLRSFLSRYNVWLWDAWGWSDSDTHMWSSIGVDVVGVPGSKSQTALWDYHIYGAPDSKQYYSTVNKNPDVVWLYFSRPLPPGTWSLIRVSVIDERHTGIDDVATRQEVENVWTVEEVHIKD